MRYSVLLAQTAVPFHSNSTLRTPPRSLFVQLPTPPQLVALAVASTTASRSIPNSNSSDAFRCRCHHYLHLENPLLPSASSRLAIEIRSTALFPIIISSVTCSAPPLLTTNRTNKSSHFSSALRRADDGLCIDDDRQLPYAPLAGRYHCAGLLAK